MSALPLFGRDRELAALSEHMLPRDEQGGALMIRGEAGVGKSELLGALRGIAADRGIATLTTSGLQAETHVAFSALQRLIQPALGAVDRLSLHQRRALESALRMRESTILDFFLIALATLNLLSEMARKNPLLLVIDDAELLDSATADVLTFVARRLEREPIFMVFAMRDGSVARVERSGLPTLSVEPLDDQSSKALVDAHAPRLTSIARRRVLDEARGNPLALIELPLVFESGFDPQSPEPVPLTERLERAFAARISSLPGAVRTLLLVTALDDGGDQERILAATSIMEGREVGAEELSAAKAALIIATEGDSLRVRHPLLRSAVYEASLVAERRAAHQALATAYASEPDRGVWHQAAACSAPDDDIATALEALADRAARRGAAGEAATALERAAGLSGNEARRGQLLMRSAWLAYDSGQLEQCSALAREARALHLTARDHAMVRYLLELVQQEGWTGAAGIRSLVDVAVQLNDSGDTQHAWDALAAAASRCWWENPDQRTRDLVVSASERMGAPEASPVLLAVLAQADPVQYGRVVIERITRSTPDVANPKGMYLVGLAASAVWAYDAAYAFLRVAADGLRAQGQLGALVQVLVAQAWAAVHLAREPAALAAAEEGVSLAREMGQPRWAVSAQLAKATVAAERGDFVMTEELVRAAETWIVQSGATPMLALVHFVRGRGAVAHQHYDDGAEHLKHAIEPSDPAFHPFIGAWGLSDLVEAAAHSGDRERAEAYLTQLDALASETSASLLLATAGYARAIISDDDTAEPLFREAIGIHLANWPCYRGRMQLWYGRWLRRQRRPGESRAQLRAALDAFHALAFPTLAESARQELRASGERPDERQPQAWSQLTPQELQIAQLAASGATNRSIGQQLYLSPRTVQSHLYRIFPKLGVTARTQLRDAFPEGDVA